MATPEFKFVRNGAGYDVYDADENVRYGYTERYESRYNVRRVLVVKGWTVRLPGEARPLREASARHPMLFETRQAAAAMLWKMRNEAVLRAGGSDA